MAGLSFNRKPVPLKHEFTADEIFEYAKSCCKFEQISIHFGTTQDWIRRRLAKENKLIKTREILNANKKNFGSVK